MLIAFQVRSLNLRGAYSSFPNNSTWTTDFLSSFGLKTTVNCPKKKKAYCELAESLSCGTKKKEAVYFSLVTVEDS